MEFTSVLWREIEGSTRKATLHGEGHGNRSNNGVEPCNNSTHAIYIYNMLSLLKLIFCFVYIKMTET